MFFRRSIRRTTGCAVLTLAYLFLLAPAGLGPGPATAEAAQNKKKPKIDREELEKLVRTYDVVVRNHKAYVARTSGMDILDVEDPAALKRLGKLELTGTVNSLTLDGDLAFLAAGTLGMVIVNIADPLNPEIVSRFDTPGQTEQILVRNETALLADGMQGLVAVDVSDPAKPRRRVDLSSRNRIRGMAMEGERLILAEGTAGARVVDISRPSHPRPLYSLRNTEGALDAALEGGLLVLASGEAGLKVFVKRPGGRFEETSTLDGDGRAVQVLLRDSVAYICRGPHGIQVVDLSDPSSPVELLAMRLPRGFPALSAWLDGEVLYVAAEISGLAALDITNVRKPKILLPQARKLKVTWPE